MYPAADPPDTPRSEPESTVDEPQPLHFSGPVHGEVLDISAGGMRVLLHGDDPHAFLMRIPADFQGPFPLGGITCRVTGRTIEPDGTQLQLKFLDVPSTLEREMVRRIYQNEVQLNFAEEAPGEAPATPTETQVETQSPPEHIESATADDSDRAGTADNHGTAEGDTERPG